jgi:hypothetical protein
MTNITEKSKKRKEKKIKEKEEEIKKTKVNQKKDAGVSYWCHYWCYVSVCFLRYSIKYFNISCHIYSESDEK